jgi:HEAT repeat protein
MTKVCVLLFSACLWAGPMDEARQAITEAAQNKEGDSRREAALALSLVPAKDRVVALLDKLATDKDYQVRVAAIDTLGELNDRNRKALVKAALGDEVPEVAFAAAKALYAMKDPAGNQALESIYEGETKARSNYFQKEMRDSWRRLRTPRSAFFFAVQNGLGFVPVPGIGAGYNALMGILSDSEFTARAVSLLTVCTTNNPTCTEMMGTAFDDDDWAVRAAAIHVATTGNWTWKKSNIAALIQDKKTKVRLRAAAAYLRMEEYRPAKPSSTRRGRKVTVRDPARRLPV